MIDLSFLYLPKKKKFLCLSNKFFIIIMGVHALVIYFTLCLLVNDGELIFDDFLWELLFLKVIFSKKRGLCICLGFEFCEYAFLKWLFFSMKRDHENIFRFISILFYVILM